MVRHTRLSGIAARRLVAASVAVVACSATSLFAVDGTWITATPGTYTYGDAANWQGGTVAAGADATGNFSTLDLTGTVVVNVATDPTIGSLTFGDTDTSTAGSYDFTGGPLTISGAASTITANAMGTGGEARFDTVLAGTSNLTVTGPGTVHFAAANTLTGAVTLNNANVLLGTGTTFSLINAAGSTLNLSGTNTITDGQSPSGTMTLQSNVVANAGSVTTINMGSRTEVGQKTSGLVRTWTGAGTLNFVMGTNSSRNDFTANLTGLTGQVNISAQQVLGLDGVTMVSPTGRMLINGGNFGAGFTNAKVALNDYAVLQGITNSGGNTINFGELSGNSANAGFIAPTAGAATISVGALNTNATFAGLFVSSATNTNIITKVGTGKWTLTANQSYHTGAVNINAGTLALSGAGNLPTASTITIANGATFDVSGVDGGSYSTGIGTSSGQTIQTPAGSTASIVGNYVHGQGTLNPGTVTGAGTINVNGGLTLNGGTLNMELSPSLTPGGTNDLLNVTGTATLGGNLQLNVGLLGGLSAGTYTLLQATGGVSGSTSGWSVLFGGRGAAPTLSQTSNALQLTVSSVTGGSLVFTGAAGNGNWDINTTANFLNTATSSADKFFQLDAVRFDDTAATTAVTLVGSLAPSSVVVDTTNGYTFSGAGGIVGGGTLTKRGTGTLTVSNTVANTYGGGTTIEAGTIDIGTLGQNGIGTGAITLGGGNLRAITPTGANITLANAINVTGNSTFVTANSGTTARQSILSGAITGSGTLNITNDNLASTKGLDIANTGGFTGSLVINDGLAVRFSSTTSGNAAMALTINGTGSLGTINGSALIIPLGSLSGNGTLRGHSSSGGGSTAEFQIGSLNTSTTFSGTILDGAQGTVVRPVLITKVGTGTLSLTGANTYTGATTVKGGTLFLNSAASGPVLGNATVTAPGGADIQHGKLVLDYTGGSSPAAQVQSLLTAGYGQSPKFSTGLLRSTTVDATHVLGWVDNTTTSAVTVAYTLPGDTNVDFSVNFTDLLALAKNYNGSGKVWAQGDFDYNGLVNFTDLLGLAKNYNQSVSPAEQAALGASFSADFALAQSLAPEPATLSALGLGAVSLLGRRRRS